MICSTFKQLKPRITPCCNTAIHEECLANSFYASYIWGQYKCPFCRRKMNPYNVDELLLTADSDAIAYRLKDLRFIHNQWTWNANDDQFHFEPMDRPLNDIVDNLFLADKGQRIDYTCPVSLPPPSWAEEMQRIRTLARISDTCPTKTVPRECPLISWVNSHLT